MPLQCLCVPDKSEESTAHCTERCPPVKLYIAASRPSRENWSHEISYSKQMGHCVACADISFRNYQKKAVPLQVTVTVTCTAPFLQSPKLQLGYTSGGQSCSQNLPLPITTTKFVTPPDAPIPRDAFFSRWRALAGISKSLIVSGNLRHFFQPCILLFNDPFNNREGCFPRRSLITAHSRR